MRLHGDVILRRGIDTYTLEFPGGMGVVAWFPPDNKFARRLVLCRLLDDLRNGYLGEVRAAMALAEATSR